MQLGKEVAGTRTHTRSCWCNCMLCCLRCHEVNILSLTFSVCYELYGIILVFFFHSSQQFTVVFIHWRQTNKEKKKTFLDTNRCTANGTMRNRKEVANGVKGTGPIASRSQWLRKHHSTRTHKEKNGKNSVKYWRNGKKWKTNDSEGVVVTSKWRNVNASNDACLVFCTYCSHIN